MPSLVLGTAGHIDHGKSSLIKALTGTDPDRLKEEKDRGITIELGFARLELPSGRSMGVVDVPGHEKFVRQMVAGATGIDVVLLVVAADDGVMPQTREHLAIIDLLGVEKGVVALTKADLVDSDWIELVTEDVRQLLVGTGIEGAPIVAVSSRTRQGLDDLLAELDELATETPSRQAKLSMRLPADRVFTISGAGTVVTGTMWSGTARRDDAIEVYPDRTPGRIRSLQVHGEQVESAQAGQRVAMNIAGVDKQELSRGDVIAVPGSLTVTDRFDAHFTFLGQPGDDRPFETGTRVHVHHGTREVLGRVLLMDGESVSPGGGVLAQIRLEEPLVPRYGDRFIVRSYSPVYTVGGGMVLDVLPPRRTQLKPHERELLDALVVHDLHGASLGLLESRGIPMSSAEVSAALGVARAAVADELNRAKLDRLKVGSDTYFVTSEALTSLVATTESALLTFHAENPTESGIATAALRDLVDRRLDARVFDAVLAEAASRGVAVAETGRVRHPKAAVSALAAEQTAAEAIVPMLDAAGLEPPSVADIAAATGAEVGVVRKVLGRLASDGAVVRVTSELHFSAGAYESAREKLRPVFAANPGGATAAELRDALGVSRKFAIPLLEHFDAHGFTKRVGDLRTLRG
jgi:selenocysteine-specific elongation factor